MNKLPDKIVEGIYNEELSNIGIDIAELSLDNLMDDGFVKDLPVIGTIVKLFKAGLDIRDRIFIAKVARFLFNLKYVPNSNRELFKSKIENNAEFKKNVGSTLVLLLDRLDDIEKPDLIAKCFTYYLSEKIKFNEFKRLSSSIDATFIDDLRFLIAWEANRYQNYTGYNYENLYRTGFAVIQEIGSLGTRNHIYYELSPLGLLFKDIMNDLLNEENKLPLSV